MEEFYGKWGEIVDCVVMRDATTGRCVMCDAKNCGNIVISVGSKKGKGSPYSIAKRRVPELILVLGSQPAGDVSHKPGGRLPLLSAITLTTLKGAATNFATW